MNPLSTAAGALSGTRSARAYRLPAGLPTAYVLGIGAGVVLGVAAYLSAQAACSFALVAMAVCLYVRNRITGMVVVWALWFAIPMVRRLFALLESAPGSDPLSLAPFVATAAVALIEINRTALDKRAKIVLGLVGAGILLGVPSGAAEPQAMLFAFGAYLSAMAALLIGYAEGPRTLRQMSLYRAVLIVGFPLALYGIAQYFLALPSWDELWQSTVADDYGSIGSPEEGKVRVWSAMNGPGTLAAVLAIAALLLLSTPRLKRWHVLLLAAVTTCLALTFVRSAWVALVVGLVAFGFAARGGQGRRAVTFLVLLAIGVAGLSGTGATGSAFSERVLTIGSPSEDTSAQARSSTTRSLGAAGLTKPLGSGLGSAGEAAKLRGAGGLSDPDNGYLSILYQNGPVALLLFLAAMILGLRSAVEALRRARPAPIAGVLVALLTMFAAMEFFGDALYGVTGAIFWYLVGIALRLRGRSTGSQPEDTRREPRQRPRTAASLARTRKPSRQGLST